MASILRGGERLSKADTSSSLNSALVKRAALTCGALDYAICTGGTGPLAAGAVVNLHNGNVFATGSYSGTTIPNEIIKSFDYGKMAPREFGKQLLKTVSIKGGGCSFGYITNKPSDLPTGDFVDRWLPGRGVTMTAGFRGITGGVTIPDGQDLFDSEAQIGIEGGIGTTRADISRTVTVETNYEINIFNKRN